MAPHAPRNRFLVPGIPRYSRSRVYAKKALYKRKKITIPKSETKIETTKTKQIKGNNNGGERVIPIEKAPRFYPAEDVPHPKKSRKVNKPTKLRASITPGTILILLTGRFRGKRVVFLNQLKSGLLLVTGPFKVNGVPLKRVNQAYVIATSTKVDISSCSVDKFDDSYFKREKEPKKKSEEEEFFGEDQNQKKVVSEARANDQKEIDKQLLDSLKKEPHFYDYLRARFSLTKGQFPHHLAF
ncbi:ribosomal protein L6e-domain-containing protein [Glomus cerebriforme]|uniref:Ribosomal protein L6e-domain-containing protein n=1 Tax=Glomus cerebriforme TaxID=658196 RepID=A0A397TD96_9GLOM|nr:ribosomal protein L6e-domain-containing protein [Glomus cerebriforme]